MVQCPVIFHMCTADPSLFRISHSNFLNSHFNAHCHLPAGLAFIQFKVFCSKTGYVVECISVFLSLSLPVRAFGGLYSRIPKLMYSLHPQT